MGPVIKRISKAIGNGLGPFFELLIVACITRAESLVHAVGSHRAPLVVVAVKPYLREVLEPVVGCYFVRGKMTVIVVDGHFLRMFVIENPRSLILQEKIFRHKFSGHF
ncbi:hypothetical protein ES703_104178 [subsurface metagenome]